MTHEMKYEKIPPINKVGGIFLPRRIRKQVEPGIYHVMLRGNEKKDIFYDEQDKQRMVDTVIKVRNHKS